VCSLDRDEGPRAEPADLVVDASGRRSRTPEWLGRHGYPAPQEDRLRVDLTYVTRRFARRGGDVATVTSGASTLLHPATPGGRAGVLIAQEDAWTASCAGYHGTRPPTDLAGFTSYARTLTSPAMADAVSDLEPIDDGAVLRFPGDVRRRYERLDRFPRGLLVTGDALCALDPTLGQGTTVAALEARELRTCLREGTDDLAPRFFARAARRLAPAWAASVGCVPRAWDQPDRRSPGARWHGRYVAMARRAAVEDRDLAVALLRVDHLVEPPSSLVAPTRVLRVLRGRALHRRTAATAAPAPQPPDHRGPAGTPARERHLP
jgi:2-polyprenyl-6-methoxyphenol hydroxylase-like FAD-dependent oxidoreductase